MSKTKVKVLASPVKARDLNPGDLFSSVGPEYWDRFRSVGGVGEKCFIRTNSPAENADDDDAIVYRLSIVAVATADTAAAATIDDLPSVALASRNDNGGIGIFADKENNTVVFDFAKTKTQLRLNASQVLSMLAALKLAIKEIIH